MANSTLGYTWGFTVPDGLEEHVNELLEHIIKFILPRKQSFRQFDEEVWEVFFYLPDENDTICIILGEEPKTINIGMTLTGENISFKEPTILTYEDVERFDLYQTGQYSVLKTGIVKQLFHAANACYAQVIEWEYKEWLETVYWPRIKQEFLSGIKPFPTKQL